MSIIYKGQKITGTPGSDVIINGVKTSSIEAGENVEISQDGNILTINVKSVAPILQRIEITAPPDKTAYNLGDVFDSTGMVVTAIYDKEPSKEIANYTISPDGPLQAEDNKVTISYTEGDVTASAEQAITVISAHIYGAMWDGTATAKWSRTDEAASFTDPVPYVAGSSSYGSPFDNLMPWAGMVKSERAGGTMVAIPKFWYKLEQNTPGTPSSGMSIKIADMAVEGFSVSPAHMDRGDGKGERDVVYIGRYHCASDYKSRTGELPKINITIATARSEIHNLESNIWQMDFAIHFTIWLLYLVEFADWNTQKTIGNGCGNNSNTGNMGYTDSMPYHTGTTQTNRGTYGLGTQYRNIEGLWDNVYDWRDGCYSSNSGFNIILNPNNFSDTTGGVCIGNPVSGFSSAFNVKDVSGAFPAFIPVESRGRGDDYSCDYWSLTASYPCACVGGDYNNSSKHGLFGADFSAASGAFGNVGARPQELP